MRVRFPSPAPILYGQVPEWPKGADCKSAVTDFDGSNPSLPTIFAGMAELADALDSGSSESNFMQVQVLFPAPPRDSDIDTISGSFLLHLFGSTMQNSRDFELKLVFEEGKLQDFVSLNQMLNSHPDG